MAEKGHQHPLARLNGLVGKEDDYGVLRQPAEQGPHLVLAHRG